MMIMLVSWLDTAQQVITLIVGFLGLIGTVVSTYFAVKAVIAKNKDKSLAEIWAFVMGLADEAMKAAEASGKNGADKKQMVIDAVKAAALAAGIDLSPLHAQLDAYIDQAIAFVNGMTKK